jgi:hypothetical protein
VSGVLTINDDELDLNVSVAFERWDSYDGKAGFHYWITAGGITVQGDDLRCPKADLAPALETLLVFLATWVNSIKRPDSEHLEIFSSDLRPWAADIDGDSIALLAQEVLSAD